MAKLSASHFCYRQPSKQHKTIVSVWQIQCSTSGCVESRGLEIDFATDLAYCAQCWCVWQDYQHQNYEAALKSLCKLQSLWRAKQRPSTRLEQFMSTANNLCVHEAKALPRILERIQSWLENTHTPTRFQISSFKKGIRSMCSSKLQVTGVLEELVLKQLVSRNFARKQSEESRMLSIHDLGPKEKYAILMKAERWVKQQTLRGNLPKTGESLERSLQQLCVFNSRVDTSVVMAALLHMKRIENAAGKSIINKSAVLSSGHCPASCTRTVQVPASQAGTIAGKSFKRLIQLKKALGVDLTLLGGSPSEANAGQTGDAHPCIIQVSLSSARILKSGITSSQARAKVDQAADVLAYDIVRTTRTVTLTANEIGHVVGKSGRKIPQLLAYFAKKGLVDVRVSVPRPSTYKRRCGNNNRVPVPGGCDHQGVVLSVPRRSASCLDAVQTQFLSFVEQQKRQRDEATVAHLLKLRSLPKKKLWSLSPGESPDEDYLATKGRWGNNGKHGPKKHGKHSKKGVVTSKASRGTKKWKKTKANLPNAKAAAAAAKAAASLAAASVAPADAAINGGGEYEYEEPVQPNVNRMHPPSKTMGLLLALSSLPSDARAGLPAGPEWGPWAKPDAWAVQSAFAKARKIKSTNRRNGQRRTFRKQKQKQKQAQGCAGHDGDGKRPGMPFHAMRCTTQATTKRQGLPLRAPRCQVCSAKDKARASRHVDLVQRLQRLQRLQRPQRLQWLPPCSSASWPQLGGKLNPASPTIALASSAPSAEGIRSAVVAAEGGKPEEAVITQQLEEVTMQRRVRDWLQMMGPRWDRQGGGRPSWRSLQASVRPLCRVASPISYDAALAALLSSQALALVGDAAQPRDGSFATAPACICGHRNAVEKKTEVEFCLDRVVAASVSSFPGGIGPRIADWCRAEQCRAETNTTAAPTPASSTRSIYRFLAFLKQTCEKAKIQGDPLVILDLVVGAKEKERFLAAGAHS
jgi:hypothetical protein